MTERPSPRRPWSEEEKQKLLRATEESQNGGMQIQWDEVALQFESRSKVQLKSFFFNCLKPKIDASRYKHNALWDARLDRQLCGLVQQHGKKWKAISELMPQCSPSQLKLRFFYLQKQHDGPRRKNSARLDDAGPRGRGADQLEHDFLPVMQKIREILEIRSGPSKETKQHGIKQEQHDKYMQE